MKNIRCTCLHWVDDMSKGKVVTYKDHNREGELVEVTAFYCLECAKDKLEDAGREGIWDIDRDNPLTK